MSDFSSFKRVDEITGADDIAARSCSEVLRSLNKQVSLFTPALMITVGRFDRDPVIEFDARFPAESDDLRPFCVDLKPETDEAFFSGLGVCKIPGRPRAINWDKRLYGIVTEREEECFAFLSGIAFSDSKTGYFASTFAYDIPVPDPTSRFKEMLQVKVFGVISNTIIAMLDAQKIGPPTVKQLPVPDEKAAVAFLQQNGILSPFNGNDPLKQ